MKLSVVIPAHNEEDCLYDTVYAIVNKLQRERILHEVVIVNDNSTDSTEKVCQQLALEFPTVRYVDNHPPNGFGFAVRRGLAEFEGDAVAIVMADASDDPKDLLAGYYKLVEGYDCVFGSRFIKGGKVVDYPFHKLFINRLANLFIKVLFGLSYNDTTNAFKLYRREVIEGVQPILSHHFNLTVELPLKALVRGYSYAVIPIRWYNRQTGISKLKIKEMGSRYLFIVLYVWLERHLSRGDYYCSKNYDKAQVNV
ncbi:MAG: glycosyltransferase family 2 protein [Leptolyngbya sp.]|nr:MAG: glycosyltransferase family 2 protein [Leptolyngbya sp.]